MSNAIAEKILIQNHEIIAPQNQASFKNSAVLLIHDISDME